jgi:basic amino acid/polyamine antiporter, APA family
MSNNLINNSVISNDKEKKEDQFDRSLGYWDLSFAGYSLIVGAGIFTLMPFIINNAKGYSWLAFIIGGFISVLTGFSFIRLNMEYPVNDAEYSWFLGIIGDKKQPKNSFRNKLAKGGAAVLIWIVMLCVIAAIATVSAGMKDFIHLLGIKMNSYVLIFLAIFVPTFINIVGTKYTSGLNQIIMTGITLLFAFVIGIAIKNHKYIGEINFFNKPAKQNVSNIAKAAFMSIFAFNGFQALVQMSEETKNPANISKAMATSISFSTIVYVLISISIISIIGLSSSAKNGAPLSQAFATVIGKRGGDITTLMCIICMFSTILFSLLGGSRLLKNFAEIGIAPRFLKKISSLPQFLTGKSNSSNNKSIENYENKQIENKKKNKIFENMPINALIILSIASFICVLAGKGVLETLATSSNIMIFIIWSSVHLLTIINYHKKDNKKYKFLEKYKDSPTLAKLAKMYPWYSVLGLITTLYMLFKARHFLNES